MTLLGWEYSYKVFSGLVSDVYLLLDGFACTAVTKKTKKAL